MLTSGIARYLRIDRGYLWPDLKDAFNVRFSQKRAIGGLQCRYYRLIEQNHMPQVRNMTRTADSVQRYGMRTTLARAGTGKSYPVWSNTTSNETSICSACLEIPSSQPAFSLREVRKHADNCR